MHDGNFSWTDSSGRQWTPKPTIGLAEQLRAEGMDLFNPETMAQIYADPLRFMRFVAAFYRGQIEEAGITADEFVNSLLETSGTADRAISSTEEAITDFLSKLPGGKAVAAVIARASEAARQTDSAQTQEIRGARGNQAVHRLVTRATAPVVEALDKLGAPGGPSGPSQES